MIAQSQVEEEGDLDKVGQALCEGAGGGGRLRSDHDKAQQDGFFEIWRWLLVGKVSKYPG